MRAHRTVLHPQVHDALQRALAGDGASAHEGLVAVSAPLDDRSTAVAARVLYLVRAYDDALRLLDRAAPSAGRGYLSRLRYAFLKRLRFEQEATAGLEQMLRGSPDAQVHEAAVLHYRGVDEYERALSHVEAVLSLQPAAVHWYRSKLELAAFLERPEPASNAASAALAVEPQSWPSLVDDLLRAGGFDTAQAILSAHAGSPRATAVEAELALFRGDYDQARELAQGVDDPRARTALFGALIAKGELEAADELARSAATGPTWITWHAELRYRTGDHTRAVELLRNVLDRVPDYFAAKLLFALADLERRGAPSVHRGAYEELFLGQLQATGVDVGSDVVEITIEAARDAIHEAVRRLRGNRTPYPTVVRDGRLELLRVPASGRHRVRRAQHASRHLGIAAASARVDAVLSELGQDPVAECYRGELDLWGGDYELAERRFRTILAARHRTTWAWIGLGAAQTLSGNPGKGIETLDEGVKVLGFRGATLPVYRADALWRLGRLEEATAEVDEAVRLHPGRLSAWLLRTIIAAERRDAATRDVAFDHLQDAAAALLSDAAVHLGLPTWWPGQPSADDKARLARAALELMRGNRSSSCMLWSAPRAGGAVRSLVHERPVTTPEWEKDEIEQLRRV
jgi:tetratricopeptide (TPR) repeat protein